MNINPTVTVPKHGDILVWPLRCPCCVSPCSHSMLPQCLLIFNIFDKCVCVWCHRSKLDQPVVLHVPCDPTHAQLPPQAVSTHTHTHAQSSSPPDLPWFERLLQTECFLIYTETHTHTHCAWILITLLHTEIIYRRPPRKTRGTKSAETPSSSFKPAEVSHEI